MSRARIKAAALFGASILLLGANAAKAPAPAAEFQPPPYSPPVVSHDVDREMVCLDCHNTEAAPALPHRVLENCRQCHVPQRAKSNFRRNLFEKQDVITRAPRPSPSAPPSVPHRIPMRENCLACHTEGTRGAPKTPHPERIRCRQCHVAQENVRPFGASHPSTSR